MVKSMQSNVQTLSQDVTLDITIVVFRCPDESTRRFNSLGYHVVNEPMLIIDTELIEGRLVFPNQEVNSVSLQCRMDLRIVYFLENVLEASVIFLQYGVLC